ncbi:hypothetical protein D9M68_370390 [compost metagenome]
MSSVLSYELLEHDRSSAGSLLARQAAAGNLGQALGTVGAGILFGWNALAPFWAAAAVLLLGGAAALRWWGRRGGPNAARGEQRDLRPGTSEQVRKR